MRICKSTIALAVAGVMALGAAGQAQASAYAVSANSYENLLITFGDNNAVDITSFSFTLTNTATLNGVSDATKNAACGGTLLANDCGPATPRLDAAPANAPGGSAAATRTNNTFNFFGPGAYTYSNSDSVLYTSELLGDASTSAQQIAESEVQLGGGTGNANAEITSSTGFVLEFIISGTNWMELNFNASPFLRAALSDPNFFSGLAQANIGAEFTLTNEETGEQVSWSPEGNTNNNCDSDNAAITCSEISDTFDLNRNLSVTSNNTDLNPLTGAQGTYGVRVEGLTDGIWSIALNSITSTTVRLETVPEPGSLALLGLGLAGLGLTRYRRKQA